MNTTGGRRTSAAGTSHKLERIRFGEYLVEKNLITDEQLLAALGDHWSNGGKIGAAISRSGFLVQEEVEKQAALYHDLDVVEI